MNRIYLMCSVLSLQLLAQIPKNDSIVNYVKKSGSSLAPSYHKVVCTDFLVKVLRHFTTIDRLTYKRIQIITDASITDLIDQKSEIPNGVCYALASSGKGKYVPQKEAKRGDFVQYWNSFFGCYNSGHCGILDHIDERAKKIYMYSSHPQTDGFGLHVFDLPDYLVFARLI